MIGESACKVIYLTISDSFAKLTGSSLMTKVDLSQAPFVIPQSSNFLGLQLNGLRPSLGPFPFEIATQT